MGVVPQIKRMEMEARSFSADRSRTLLVKVSAPSHRNIAQAFLC